MLQNNMTNIQLSLFCLVDGESTPFPVEIESTKTIGDLKRAIKDDNAIAFADVDAKMLTLWHVSIPVLPKKDLKEISLAEVHRRRSSMRKMTSLMSSKKHHPRRQSTSSSSARLKVMQTRLLLFTSRFISP
ncbi:MAG: hypothetical protein BYD32DRAFT_402000 [Podila humilis]|nr:MAG: hypothetical protein BYD32DRAFT_402000 [Podila humilis]